MVELCTDGPQLHLLWAPTWYTLRHVLKSCTVSLHHGRYSWRHNAVLSVPKRHLLKFWKEVGKETRSFDAPFLRLVPEHAVSLRLHSPGRSQRSLFSSDALRCSPDWVFFFDIKDAPIVPPDPLEDRVSDAHTVQPLPKVKSLPHFLNMFQLVDCSNFLWIERLCTKILLSFCRTKKFSPQRLKEL